MCCLYASANQAPANRPAIAKTTPTVPGTQSGHLFCLATLPIANAIANASAKPAVKHTTKNAISIPTLYHIRDEENVLIQARNIDFDNFRYPFIGSVILDIGDIYSNRTYTATEDCFIVGKAFNTSAHGNAYIEVGGCQVGGLMYTSSSSMIQVGLCIPLAKGQTAYFVTTDGQFQNIRIAKAVWETS